jgi:hypothetical protein
VAGGLVVGCWGFCGDSREKFKVVAQPSRCMLSVVYRLLGGLEEDLGSFGDRQQTFQNAKSGYLECYIGHLERDTNSPTNKTDEPSKRRWPPKPWQPCHPSSPYLRATTQTPRRAIPNNYVAQKKQSPKKSSPHHNNKALFLLLPRQYRNGTQQKVWG